MQPLKHFAQLEHFERLGHCTPPTTATATTTPATATTTTTIAAPTTTTAA
jgi:hypothetical protein